MCRTAEIPAMPEVLFLVPCAEYTVSLWCIPDAALCVLLITIQLFNMLTLTRRALLGVCAGNFALSRVHVWSQGASVQHPIAVCDLTVRVRVRL